MTILFRHGLATAALAGAFALLACSGKAVNNFNGGGGDQCLSQAVNAACFSCLQNNCSAELGSFENSCSDFIGCACSGGSYSYANEQSPNCQQALTSNSSCSSASGAIGSCTTQKCGGSCLDQGSGSSSGGSASSSSGSSSGGTSSSSSGGVSSSGSGSGSSSGGMSSSSSSGGVMGTTACGFMFGSTTCASCVSTSCCTMADACANDPACGQLVTCVSGCAQGDMTCLQNCGNAAGATPVQEFNSFVMCLQSSCASAGC